MTAEAGTWKGASSELRMMSVSSTALPVVGERRAGTGGSRYGRFSPRTWYFACRTSPGASFLRPALPYHQSLATHFPYLHMLGFPDIFLLGLFLKLS